MAAETAFSRPSTTSPSVISARFGGVAPYPQDGERAVADLSPGALELGGGLLQQLLPVGQPHHHGGLVLPQVIADQAHARSGLAHACRKMQHRPPRPVIQQFLDPCRRVTLMREQAVLGSRLLLECRRKGRYPVDREAEELQQFAPLVRRPLQALQVVQRRLLVAHGAQALRQLRPLGPRNQGDQGGALSLVGDQTLGVDGDRGNGPEAIVSRRASLDQIEQSAQPLADVPRMYAIGASARSALKDIPGDHVVTASPAPQAPARKRPRPEQLSSSTSTPVRALQAPP